MKSRKSRGKLSARQRRSLWKFSRASALLAVLPLMLLAVFALVLGWKLGFFGLVGIAAGIARALPLAGLVSRGIEARIMESIVALRNIKKSAKAG